MRIDYKDERPLFVQVADGIEDTILLGACPEGAQIPSTTEISVALKINPATALKGVNLLVDRNIVHKKRGVGMFVSDGAVERLKDIRKEAFFEDFVLKLTEEAERLGLTREETIKLVEKGFGE